MNSIEMFKSEAKIAINLTQGNIAQIYEFGEEKDQFFLASMEYIEGRNSPQANPHPLHQATKALTIEQCVYVIAQVANGLDHVTHRCIQQQTRGKVST